MPFNSESAASQSDEVAPEPFRVLIRGASLVLGSIAVAVLVAFVVDGMIDVSDLRKLLASPGMAER